MCTYVPPLRSSQLPPAPAAPSASPPRGLACRARCLAPAADTPPYLETKISSPKARSPRTWRGRAAVTAAAAAEMAVAPGEGGGGRGGVVLNWRYVLDLMYGRSRMPIDPRIPTVSGRSMSGFHRPGRHCLHQVRSAVRCPSGQSHEG